MAMAMRLARSGFRESLRRAALREPGAPISSGVLTNAAGGRRSAFSQAVYAPQTYMDKSIVAQRVVGLFKSLDKFDPAKVSLPSDFKKDLEMDILDKQEVIIALEDEFAIDISGAEADKINSCEDAATFISSHPQAK